MKALLDKADMATCCAPSLDEPAPLGLSQLQYPWWPLHSSKLCCACLGTVSPSRSFCGNCKCIPAASASMAIAQLFTSCQPVALHEMQGSYTLFSNCVDQALHLDSSMAACARTVKHASACKYGYGTRAAHLARNTRSRHLDDTLYVTQLCTY